MRLESLRSLIAPAALGLGLSLAGCGGLAEQLQAENVAIATLIKTPDLDNPQTHETVKGSVAFTLFFGQIDKSKITVGTDGKQSAADGAFKGLTKAIVKLDFNDGTAAQEINVPEVPNKAGAYEIDSTTASKLTYAKTDYEVLITYSGQTYKLKVAAPDKTDIKEFAAAQDGIIKDHEAGKDFTVTRSVAKGAANNPIAFVNLSNLTDSKPDQWNNLPKDALGFLQLVLNDGAWRQDSFTIPGAQFASQSGYLVTMSAMERGAPEDGAPALFLGSSFFAGVASGGGVITK